MPRVNVSRHRKNGTGGTETLCKRETYLKSLRLNELIQVSTYLATFPKYPVETMFDIKIAFE